MISGNGKDNPLVFLLTRVASTTIHCFISITIGRVILDYTLKKQKNTLDTVANKNGRSWIHNNETEVAQGRVRIETDRWARITTERKPWEENEVWDDLQKYAMMILEG